MRSCFSRFTALAVIFACALYFSASFVSADTNAPPTVVSTNTNTNINTNSDMFFVSRTRAQNGPPIGFTITIWTILCLLTIYLMVLLCQIFYFLAGVVWECGKFTSQTVVTIQTVVRRWQTRRLD